MIDAPQLDFPDDIILVEKIDVVLTPIIAPAQLAFPKPIRIRDRAYLAWIRLKPCVGCRRIAKQAHHVIARGAGGSDYQTVPLCFRCHRQVHDFGRDFFEVKHAIDLEIEARLLFQKWQVFGAVRTVHGQKRCRRIARDRWIPAGCGQ